MEFLYPFLEGFLSVISLVVRVAWPALLLAVLAWWIRR